MKPWMKKNGRAAVRALNRIRHSGSATAKKYQPGFAPLPADIIDDFNAHRSLGPQPWICYAPFKMMYFAFNGEVIACCHNRKHLLGRYPENSIQDIWHGSPINTLRSFIRNDDLSHGCEVCKTLLLSRNFEGAKNGLYDRYSAGKWPLTMEFELDNTCNLACVFCNDLFSTQHLQSSPKNNPYDDRFVAELRAFLPHLKEVKFYGGEPFLIPIYYKIWDELRSLNPGVSILVQTNGTVLNDKVRSYLAQGRFSINVSIDSLHKETFENIRHNADFEKTIENTRWFSDYCKRAGTHFGIIPTPCRLNWRDLPDITRWAGELGGFVYFNTLITPLDLALWNLKPEALSEIHQQLSSATLSTKTPTDIANKKHFEDFLVQLKAWEEINRTDNNNKQGISENNIQAIKNSFLARLHQAVASHPHAQEMLMLFEETLLQLGESSNLIYVSLMDVPIDDVVKELESRDRDRVLKAAGKKLFEASGQYYILS
jgi:MoaA/NifB/PqqE/SkfB family radical SAM enzyme